MRMRFAAEKMDITPHPVAVGLLGTVCIMMILQNDANLIHQFEV